MSQILVPSTSRKGSLSVFKRLLVVLAVVVLYRVGVSIPAPGAGQDIASLGGSGDTALNLFNLFAGGPLTRASIFALGVTPFITASIAMQLLESIVPAIKEAKRQGKAGIQRVNAITRVVAIVLAVVQSVAAAFTLSGTSGLFADMTSGRIIMFSLSLTVGFLVLLWFAELITRHGIGNGVTILLLVSILSSVFDLSRSVMVGKGGSFFLALMAVTLLLTLIVVVASRAERRMPIVRAARFDEDTQHLSYLPFKLLHAGVAPIIFATSIMSVLATLIAFTPLRSYSVDLNQPGSIVYMLILTVLVVLFARLYERTSADPVDMANDLMKDGSFIPGVRPGWSTAHLVENASLRLALVACVILVPVALMQSISARWFDLAVLPVAGTSLLIIVTAILDTLRQARSIRSLYSYEEIR